MDYRDIRKALWQHDNKLTTKGINLVHYEIVIFSAVLGLYFFHWAVFLFAFIVSLLLYENHYVFKWTFIIYFSATYSAITWWLMFAFLILLGVNDWIAMGIGWLATPVVFGSSLYFHAMAREYLEDMNIFDDTLRF